jgi:hypothetical protein
MISPMSVDPAKQVVITASQILPSSTNIMQSLGREEVFSSFSGADGMYSLIVCAGSPEPAGRG